MRGRQDIRAVDHVGECLKFSKTLERIECTNGI